RAARGHSPAGAAFFVITCSLWSCSKPTPDKVATTDPKPAATAPHREPTPPKTEPKPIEPAPQPAATPVAPTSPPKAENSPPTPPAAPAKTDSRPAHLVALEKLGAVLDYGSGDRLIEVDLDGKPVTDADLDHLATLSDLKILNLSGSRISDEGLAKLAPLKRLKFLYLFKTEITDAGVAHLKELPRLEVLCLDQTLITDAGVKSLEALPRLEKLHVHSRVPITDGVIDSLSKHVRLFELKVGGPGFTEKGIARLREVLPNCTVHYDPKAEATEG
ncbi:MAG TPA: hypothetical protein VM452_07305, partial [Caulifigura sp.]|nr:hypothetical protein [Caulifigura sp.]